MKFEKVPARCAALVLLIASGCGTGSDADVDSSSTATPVARVVSTSSVIPEKPIEPRPKPRGALKLPVVPTPVELPAVTERSSLLHRLPKSSLFVLRLPHVENLRDAFTRTALHGMIERPQTAAQREQLSELTTQIESDLRAALPEFDDLRAGIEAMKGEAVLALVSVDVAALMGKSTSPSALPFSCAVMFDAGSQADQFDALVVRTLSSLEKPPASSAHPAMRVEREASSANNWRARIVGELVEVDALRDDAQFCFHFGPPNSTKPAEHPLVDREIEDSFLAADITRGTTDLARGGGSVVLEAFANFVPVWSALELLAPADVRNLLTASGVTSVRGLSAVAALGKTGIDEQLLIMSPGCKDLLTRCVTSRPLEASLARYLPESASTVSIGTLDLTALFDGVTKLLPDAMRRELDGALFEIKKSGFDLRADLIDNIGPTFAVTGEFDPAALLQGGDASRTPEFTIISQLRDGERLRGVLEALLSRGGQMRVQSKDIHGFRAYGMDAVGMPSPHGGAPLYFEPHWYIGDQVFVFSLSRAALARSLAAAWKEGNRGPREIQEALAREQDAFSIGISAVGDQDAISPTIGRRTSLGLEMTTREGTGSSSAYALVSVAGIAGSVALPSLVSARIQANERFVATTLRSIASAQEEFRKRDVLDADADGEGEYGTLSELAGTIAVRNDGPVLNPPLLPAEFAPGADGLMRARGYVFRVDLSNRLTRRIDFDEKEFFAYAWPESLDGSMRRTFVIEATGKVLATENDEPEQGYVGIERMPKPDASKRIKSGSPKVTGSAPRSVDGGIWREL